MNTYYYTDELRLKNDILEYKHKEDFIKVKKHNWHHILNEYGWEKINKRWIIILNKYSDNKRVPEYVYNYNNTIFKKNLDQIIKKL